MYLYTHPGRQVLDNVDASPKPSLPTTKAVLENSPSCHTQPYFQSFYRGSGIQNAHPNDAAAPGTLPMSFPLETCKAMETTYLSTHIPPTAIPGWRSRCSSVPASPSSSASSTWLRRLHGPTHIYVFVTASPRCSRPTPHRAAAPPHGAGCVGDDHDHGTSRGGGPVGSRTHTQTMFGALRSLLPNLPLKSSLSMRGYRGYVCTYGVRPSVHPQNRTATRRSGWPLLDKRHTSSPRRRRCDRRHSPPRGWWGVRGSDIQPAIRGGGGAAWEPRMRRNLTFLRGGPLSRSTVGCARLYRVQQHLCMYL